MLYTSVNASLALLEILVHADESEIPPQMFLSHISISEKAPIYEFQDHELPKNWRQPANLRLRALGDRMIAEKKYAGFKVRSAVLPSEWNVLLNPLYPGFADLVKVSKIEKIQTDIRLI